MHVTKKDARFLMKPPIVQNFIEVTLSRNLLPLFIFKKIYLDGRLTKRLKQFCKDIVFELCMTVQSLATWTRSQQHPINYFTFENKIKINGKKLQQIYIEHCQKIVCHVVYYMNTCCRQGSIFYIYPLPPWGW